MHHRLDPNALCGHPMRLHRIGIDDYRVTIRDHVAGRIFRTTRGGNQQVWLWSLTGPCCTQAGLGSSGEAITLDAAKPAFRATFDSWLAWAIRQNGEVAWHE